MPASSAKTIKKKKPDLWLLIRPGSDPANLQHGDLIYNQEPEDKLSILAWEDKESAGTFWSANQKIVGDWQVSCVKFADFQKYLATLTNEQREAIFLRMG